MLILILILLIIIISYRIKGILHFKRSTKSERDK
jgi:hypothetical protein